MSATKVLASSSLLCAAVFGFAGGHQDEQRAMDLLARSMKGSFHVNVIAILQQRDPGGDGFQQVKLIRSKSGKQRLTILAPLRVANIESVDDGDRQKTFLPDEKVIIDQPSPLKFTSDVSQRIDLARRNYTVTMQPKRQIAGRTAVCVAATPRNSEMNTRRYFLDEITGYPLRIETVEEDGDTHLVVEAKAIDYPKSLDRDLFELRSRPGVESVTYTRPRSLSVSQAQAAVGFAPLVPKGLPMGFKVQQIQYSGRKDWKAVAVHLTDGLARAIVYEWLPDGKPVKVMNDSTFGEVNGVRILLVSELGPKVRQKLLQAYISQVEQSDAVTRPSTRTERTPTVNGRGKEPQSVASAFPELYRSAAIPVGVRPSPLISG